MRPTRDAAELDAAMALRRTVFLGEQGVSPEEEFDGLDDESTQIVGLDEAGVIATCRLRYIESETCKLERMAVEHRLRKLGVGSRLLAGAEAEARRQGAAEMLLHAQRRAEPFYASNGYVAEGEAFMEAEIEHVRMRKALR
ncbi:MAG: GNAT family N-acetyltransferase [Solirubrobacterales bacterium]